MDKESTETASWSVKTNTNPVCQNNNPMHAIKPHLQALIKWFLHGLFH
jgi:hypothetical protein